jgi:hypothetical protein
MVDIDYQFGDSPGIRSRDIEFPRAAEVRASLRDQSDGGEEDREKKQSAR